MKHASFILSSISLLGLSACSMAPAYHVPTNPMAQTFKAEPGWQVAAPADDVAKGEWWKLFKDPALDALEAKVAVTNQNVVYYRAAWAQARGLVQQDRASLFPTISGGASTTRSGSFGGGTGGSVTSGATTSARVSSSYSADVSGSWTPDLWGQLANTVKEAKAQAEASKANLDNATLAAQGELASDYMTLRGLDAQTAMLDDTIKAYQRSLDITKNQYHAGTVSNADVYTAQTTLNNAQASRRDLDRQRATYENAIAVLIGENPSNFKVPVVTWTPVVPAVPSALPGEIVQRRPDVAADERAVAAANANIGIQKAAFFPTITLTGEAQTSGTALSDLFTSASSLWSTGASAALTLLDFGARSAKVKQARAAYDEAVATYRQAVLTAFQQVENYLAATSSYAAQQGQYDAAAEAANKAEVITRNEYLAGTVDYTTVTTAQATAYSARVNQIQNTVNQQTNAIALIQAVGGHW
jgi:NodT family efflux transporter outer membrane factor (OMF) lipoprotein